MTQTTEEIDAALAAAAKAPRVSLADIEANIASKTHFRLSDAIRALDMPVPPSTAHVSMCVVVTQCGWVAIGKSAPIAGDNFDPSIGRRLAAEDATRQLWPLMGYALKSQLAATTVRTPPIDS